MIEEAKPDLILLDWMMPNVSGLEVCRQLRRGSDTLARCRTRATAGRSFTCRLRRPRGSTLVACRDDPARGLTRRPKWLFTLMVS